MKFLLVVLVVLLPVMAFSSMNDQRGNPEASDPVVTFNGEETTVRVFNIGDTINVSLNATDPNGLPLQYVFRRYRKNMLNATLMNWSSTYSIDYTFTEVDATGAFSIVGGVKNNDGVDSDGFFGDLQRGVSIQVNSSALYPPTISAVEVYFNDVLTTDRNFTVGDTIKIKILASDPGSLPLEYIYQRYVAGSFVETLFDWSADLEQMYTFTADDLIGVTLELGVRNDDGVDYDPTLGDVKASVSFTVTQ